MKKIKINKENKEEKARKVKKSAPKMPNSAFTEQEIQYYFSKAETPYYREIDEEI